MSRRNQQPVYFGPRRSPSKAATILACAASFVAPFAILAGVVYLAPPELLKPYMRPLEAHSQQQAPAQVPEVDCDLEPECWDDGQGNVLPEIPEGRRWRQIGPDTYILLRQDSNINPIYMRRS